MISPPNSFIYQSMSALLNNPFLSLSLLGALSLRLLFLWESSANPFFDAPIVDAQTFLRQAQSIAAGDLWGGSEPFWQPPLYIYLLALICWLFPSDYFLAIRLLQAALGTLSCGILYAIARRCFDEKTARIASIGAALCGSSIFFEGELLAVALEVFLNLLLLQRLLVAVEKPAYAPWVGTGLLAGLAALTRPNVLLFIAAFALCYFLTSIHDPKGKWKKSLRLLLLLGSLALVIIPTTVRNYMMEPELVLISSNGGINFYIGNSGHYDEKVSIHPGMRWEAMAMEPVRAGHTTAAAKSAYFYARSFEYIAAHPLEYAQTLLRKLFLFFSGPEIKRNFDIYFARQYSYVLSFLLWDYALSFPFGLIGPLSLIGLYITWHHRSSTIALIRLYALTYVLSVVLFFVAARYRMPVLPVLIVFASVGGLGIYNSVRRGTGWRRSKTLWIFAALTLVFNLPSAADHTRDAQLQFDLGEVYLRKESYELAAAHAQKALQLEPSYNYARHNLAVALFNLGALDRAIAEGEETARENPQRADTHGLLGRAYAKQGAFQRAEQSFRRALAIDPNSGITHYYYGRFLYQTHRYKRASAELEKAAAWQPGDPWIHYELGRALHGAGDETKALNAYERAWAIGQLADAANAIGAVHFVAGRPEQARAFFTHALQRDPGNLDAQINLCMIDIQEGHVQRGLSRLQSLYEQFPESPALRRALQSVSAAATTP